MIEPYTQGVFVMRMTSDAADIGTPAREAFGEVFHRTATCSLSQLDC